MKVGQITGDHFCAGVELSENQHRVESAAPIVKYMIGWTRQRLVTYCQTKGWKLDWMEEDAKVKEQLG